MSKRFGDGYYLWRLNDDEAEIYIRNGCVYELSHYYFDAEDLDNGIITPLVAMTPDVREAITAAISALWERQTIKDMELGDVLFAWLPPPGGDTIRARPRGQAGGRAGCPPKSDTRAG